MTTQALACCPMSSGGVPVAAVVVAGREAFETFEGDTQVFFAGIPDPAGDRPQRKVRLTQQRLDPLSLDPHDLLVRCSP